MSTDFRQDELLDVLKQRFGSGRAIYVPDAGPGGRRWAAEHNQHDVIGALFDICEALNWLDPNAVPAEWQYRPAPAGMPDFAECVVPDDGRGCINEGHGEECDAARDILESLGVNVQNPYGDQYGAEAERALIYAGTILGRYDRILRLYYGDI